MSREYGRLDYRARSAILAICRKPDDNPHDMTLDDLIHKVPYLYTWLQDNHQLCYTYHFFWAWRKQSLLRTVFRKMRHQCMLYRWFRTKILPKIIQAISHHTCLQIRDRHDEAEDYANNEPILFPIRHLKHLWGQERAFCFDTIGVSYHYVNCAPPTGFRFQYWTDPVGQRPDTSLAYHPFIQSWLTQWWSRPQTMFNRYNSRYMSDNETTARQHQQHIRNSTPSWIPLAGPPYRSAIP